MSLPNDDRISVGIIEAARLIGRTPWFIREEIRRGRIPVQRPHPKADPLILMDDLRAWLLGKYANAKPPHTSSAQQRAG